MYVERCDNYLSNYNFYANNINFRIKSSKALEKFKNVQSFQLNQLVNGKYFFEKDRREVLLLKYDMWSRWLCEIENYCIEIAGLKCDNNNSDEHDINIIAELANKTQESYNDIIKSNPDKFNTYLTDIWIQTHAFVFEYLKDKIKSLVGIAYNDLFPKIVDELVIVMQYTLMELHEIDSLINNYTDNYVPFIVIDQLSVDYLNHANECLIVNKLKIYKQFFNIEKIYFKNYTEQPISNLLIDNLKEINVELDYKKCITN